MVNKLIILFAATLLMVITSAPLAYADAPQDYVYGMIRCSGLAVDELVEAQQRFDTAYGWAHALTTEPQWRATYEARVNEFAHALGCPAVLRDGQLTLSYRIYAPTYRWLLR